MPQLEDCPMVACIAQHAQHPPRLSRLPPFPPLRPILMPLTPSSCHPYGPWRPSSGSCLQTGHRNTIGSGASPTSAAVQDRGAHLPTAILSKAGRTCNSSIQYHNSQYDGHTGREASNLARNKQVSLDHPFSWLPSPLSGYTCSVMIPHSATATDMLRRPYSPSVDDTTPQGPPLGGRKALD